MAGFVAVAVLVWLWHQEKWTVASWELPTAYSGDAHETLARLQAASEGDTVPLRPQVIQRLGAPFGAHWNAYPTPDKPLMLALGAVARAIGLFPAANLGLLLAQVSAALSFYLVARWGLRVRWEWAAAGALLFAYAPATFPRGLGHFSFVFTWTVPLALLSAWLVARSRRLRWGGAGGVACLGAAVALGTHNPYHLYFWLPLMGWALVAQWLGPRRRANLGVGVACLVLGLLSFGLMHWEHWFYRDEPAAQPLLVRNYGGTERYALKPVEMFIPPARHRAEPLAFLGQRYDRWSEWRGESFQPYAGLAGVAALLALAAVATHRLLTRRPVPGQALVVGWLLAFASVGGLTNLVSFFGGLQLFRATNRVVIFLLAAVLLFVVVRLARATRAWPVALRVAVALGLGGLGLLDQVPRRAPQEERAAIAQAVAADRELARELTAALPAGAMVFQLPVLGFPEVAPPWRLSDYEHFRPYLFASDLRFSYGAAKFRARSRWQRELEQVEAHRLVGRLEELGFAALYLHRGGFRDQAEGLLRDLANLGYERTLEDPAGEQVVVLLRPAAAPLLPLARAPSYGQGWHRRLDDGRRWAYAEAALSYHNPATEVQVFRWRFWLSAPDPQTVTLLRRGRAVAQFSIGPEARLCQVESLDLDPGVNTLALRSDRPPRRHGGGRYQLRSFALHRATVEPQRDAGDQVAALNEDSGLDDFDVGEGKPEAAIVPGRALQAPAELPPQAD